MRPTLECLDHILPLSIWIQHGVSSCIQGAARALRMMRSFRIGTLVVSVVLLTLNAIIHWEIVSPIEWLLLPCTLMNP